MRSFLSGLLCKKHGIRFESVVTVNNFESMFMHVESGLGIALLGASSRLTSNEKITHFTIDDPEFQVGADAVWMRDNDNPMLRDFVRMLSPTLYY
ncbi:MAG: hypothetical protein LBS32_00655 [Clostridiales Family XIII bacterium]|jgi:DNA-binding transcriptional LysR family regulator|nr:hypothetical protein [Clostridiales Family XIII bacterium]